MESWYLSDYFDINHYYNVIWSDISRQGNHILSRNINGEIIKSNDDIEYSYVSGDAMANIVFPYNLSNGYTIFKVMSKNNESISLYMYQPNLTRINKINTIISTNKSDEFGINLLNHYNWKVYEIISFNNILSESEYKCMEDQLYLKYCMLFGICQTTTTYTTTQSATSGYISSTQNQTIPTETDIMADVSGIYSSDETILEFFKDNINVFSVLFVITILLLCCNFIMCLCCFARYKTKKLQQKIRDMKRELGELSKSMSTYRKHGIHSPSANDLLSTPGTSVTTNTNNNTETSKDGINIYIHTDNASPRRGSEYDALAVPLTTKSKSSSFNIFAVKVWLYIVYISAK